MRQKGGASGFGEVAREFLMIWGRRQVNVVVCQVFCCALMLSSSHGYNANDGMDEWPDGRMDGWMDGWVGWRWVYV